MMMMTVSVSSLLFYKNKVNSYINEIKKLKLLMFAKVRIRIVVF